MAAVLLWVDMPESAAILGGLEEAGEIFLFGIVVFIAIIRRRIPLLITLGCCTVARLDHLGLADKSIRINKRCIAVGVDAFEKSVPHLLR